MKKLVFVTGNIHKGYEVQKFFNENGIPVEIISLDFHEPEVNDIEEVSKAKAIEAYNTIGTPCFVIDSGFNIWGYPNNPGYPGAFVHRSGLSEDIDKLLEIMNGIQNRTCQFLDCLTFYDGNNFYTFYGKDEGELTYEKRGNENILLRSNLWYVFKPYGCDKTLAEMTDQERDAQRTKHISAKEQFLNWYKINHETLTLTKDKKE